MSMSAASYSYKFGQVEGTKTVSAENNDTRGNIANTTDNEFNVRLVQIRKKFHKSLDFNQPPQIQLNDQSCFSMRFNYEVRAALLYRIHGSSIIILFFILFPSLECLGSVIFSLGKFYLFCV